MIDLDNTLGNRTAAVRAWAHEFSAERDLPPDAVEWILEQDNDGYSDRANVFAAIKDRYRLPALARELMSTYQDRIIALAAPTAGAFEALAELRSLGHTIAIVSNGSAKQQHGKIDAIGFRTMVDAVVISGDLDIKKPDPRIFHAAAEATDVSLAYSWMVGDSAHHDIVGAAALGVKTAWLHRDRQWTDTNCQPTVILDEMSQLVAALHQHSNHEYG